MRAATPRLGLACLQVGFSADGLYGSGAWEPGYRVPREEPGDPCDYPLIRPFALVVAALAIRSAVDFLITSTPTDFDVTWADISVALYTLRQR